MVAANTTIILLVQDEIHFLFRDQLMNQDQMMVRSDWFQSTLHSMVDHLLYGLHNLVVSPFWITTNVFSKHRFSSDTMIVKISRNFQISALDTAVASHDPLFELLVILWNLFWLSSAIWLKTTPPEFVDGDQRCRYHVDCYDVTFVTCTVLTCLESLCIISSERLPNLYHCDSLFTIVTWFCAITAVLSYLLMWIGINLMLLKKVSPMWISHPWTSTLTQKWPKNDPKMTQKWSKTENQTPNSALDYAGHPLTIRLNVGDNWAVVRTGPSGDRNKFLKGFRPSRRTLQVSPDS